MNAEILSVGTEILLGNIVNTNAAYLSEQCALLGLSVYHQEVVGDNAGRLSEAIARALSSSDILIITGGLGPTTDDLTKETASALMGFALVEDKKAREMLEERMRAYLGNDSHRRLTANNYKQALVPEGATVLYNQNGTAPGIIMEKEGKTCILLPGPPGEMIPMFKDQVFPFLREKLPEVIVSRMVKISGIGESQVAADIDDLISAQQNPTIAPYAKTGEVHLRVTAKGRSEEECRELIAPTLGELTRRFGSFIFATDEAVTLEAAVLDMLKKRGLTLSTAESLTGGALSSRLVSVPGASQVFACGYVTYSNEAKASALGVSPDTLERFGAVSAECAREMAEGACTSSGTDAAISTTGFAGPAAPSDNHPVGTVYMACAIRGKVTVREYHFKGNRNRIRESTVSHALSFLRECLLESN